MIITFIINIDVSIYFSMHDSELAKTFTSLVAHGAGAYLRFL